MHISDADHHKQNLGCYLKRLRKIHKLSLKEIENTSSISGKRISVSNLSKIESGKILPSITVLMQLSKIYDVKTRFLLEKLEIESFLPSKESLDFFDEIRFDEFPELNARNIKIGLSILKAGTKQLQFYKKKDLYLIFLHTTIFLRKTAKLDLAKDAAELLVQITQKNKRQLARSFIELALISRWQKNLPLAMAFISESERIISTIREPVFTPHLIHLKANIYKLLEKYKDAIPLYKAAIKKYRRRNFKHEVCKAFISFAVCYVDLKKFSKAIDILEKSLRMARKNNFLQSISAAYHNMGYSFYCERKWSEALRNFKESNTLAESYSYPNLILSNYFYLMKTYENLDNIELKKLCEKSLKYYYYKKGNILIEDKNVQEYIEKEFEN